ncbi:hypothetical protein ACFYL6_24575 [Micromonospora sp. NPDC007208]|uniref:hypothetical protein n=1 Tax=Micromonospora sp. NPDC007208 TaxID=3364236 RepID=UPI00367EC3D3
MTDLARLMVDRATVVEPSVDAERALFPVLASAFLRDRRRALAGAPSGGALKFGADETVLLLTPLMLETARVVWAYLVEDATRRGISWSGAAARQMFGDQSASPDTEQSSDSSPLALTVEQWNHVHQLVTQVLTGPGKIPPSRAALLADAVVGRGRLGEGPKA